MTASRSSRSTKTHKAHPQPPSPTSKSTDRVDSVTNLKARWGISDKEYERICNSFQEILQEFGVLGKRIQGITAQCAVNEATDKMLKQVRHRNTISRMDREVAQNDLRYLALLLGRNQRRRLKRDKKRQAQETHISRSGRRSSTASTESSTINANLDTPSSEPATSRTALCKVSPDLDKSSLSPPARQQVPNHFDAHMIIVRRQEEEGGRMYRLEDISPGQGFDGERTLEGLEFAQFVSILNTDFAFVHDRDVLVYESANTGKILVSNEKVWKAALWDMRSQGQRHFSFQLQRKGQEGDG